MSASVRERHVSASAAAADMRRGSAPARRTASVNRLAQMRSSATTAIRVTPAMIAAALSSAVRGRLCAVSTQTGLSAGGTSGPSRRPASGALVDRDLRSERVRDVMRREPIVVATGTSIGRGIAAIQAARADCVLVSAEGTAGGHPDRA